MVPSSATAGVPQLLHFPLNVDIVEKVLVLIRGCGSAEVRWVYVDFNLI